MYKSSLGSYNFDQQQQEQEQERNKNKKEYTRTTRIRQVYLLRKKDKKRESIKKINSRVSKTVL